MPIMGCERGKKGWWAAALSTRAWTLGVVPPGRAATGGAFAAATRAHAVIAVSLRRGVSGLGIVTTEADREGSRRFCHELSRNLKDQ